MDNLTERDREILGLLQFLAKQAENGIVSESLMVKSIDPTHQNKSWNSITATLGRLRKKNLVSRIGWAARWKLTPLGAELTV